MRRLGNSVDWERERFTMGRRPNAVKEVFVRLYKEDLIYRGKRPVNWDPKLRTAISDRSGKPRVQRLDSTSAIRFADGAKPQTVKITRCRHHPSGNRTGRLAWP